MKNTLLGVVVLLLLISKVYAKEELYDEELYDEELFALGLGKCEYLITGLHVNYVKSNVLSSIISCKNKDIFVLSEDLKNWNINPEYFSNAITQIDNQEYVNIQKLDQINYKIDTHALVFELKFPAKAMRLQTINLPEQSRADRKISGKPISGIYLNYDYALMSTDKSRTLTGNHEVTYFTKGSGVFVNKFLLQKDLSSHRQKSNDKLIRLDNYWNVDRPGDIASFRIGDNVTKGANWSSSTRFGGVQYSTNFQLNPDLVKHSLINFSDTAVVPTTLDIYTETQSILKKKIDTGDFAIEDLDVPVGNHDLTIEKTDILGRTHKIVIPYYISPNLLKPGLSEYSFSFGVQRHKYSQESNLYRNLIASFDYERGINDYWTAAGHFDLLNSRKYGAKSSIGFTNKVNLCQYGFLSFSLASNLHQLKQSQQAMVSYSYSNGDFSGGASYAIYGNDFEDSLVENSQKTSTKDRFTAQTSFGNSDLGKFSLGYMSLAAKKSRQKRLRATYSKSLKQNQNMSISYDQNLFDKKDMNISFSYNVNLRGDNSNSHNLSTNIRRTNKGDYQKNFNFSSNHLKSSGFKYSGQLSNDGKNNKYRFNVKKDNDASKMEFNTSGSQDSQSYRFGLSGSLLWMDNKLFTAPPITSSVALVKVDGYANFPVYYNNNLVTHTDKNGNAVLTNVNSNIPSKVSIKAEALKMNTHLSSPDLFIAPSWKSGMLAEFGVEEYKVLLAELMDESGEHLEENQILRIDGIDEPIFSGYYGQVYMETIPKSLDKLEGTACKDNKCCKFSAPIEKNEKEIMYDLGEILCKPVLQNNQEVENKEVETQP